MHCFVAVAFLPWAADVVRWCHLSNSPIELNRSALQPQAIWSVGGCSVIFLWWFNSPEFHDTCYYSQSCPKHVAPWLSSKPRRTPRRPESQDGTVAALPQHMPHGGDKLKDTVSKLPKPVKHPPKDQPRDVKFIFVHKLLGTSERGAEEDTMCPPALLDMKQEACRECTRPSSCTWPAWAAAYWYGGSRGRFWAAHISSNSLVSEQMYSIGRYDQRPLWGT